MCELEPNDEFNRNQLLCRKELLHDRLSKEGHGIPGRRVLEVLVVGDDRAAADELAGLVDRWGHSVRLAYDGAIALKVAAAQQPDVVLLDVSLPQEDGCQLAEQLRVELPRAKSFIITAVALRPDAEHFEQTCAAGIDLLLVKPVDPSVRETLLLLESERLSHSTAESVDQAPVQGAFPFPQRLSTPDWESAARSWLGRVKEGAHQL
jgi:CheY-like chemotaxis protein